MHVETLPDAADLPLERRVGQLFQVGFEGTEPTGSVRELVAEYGVGGVVYFARNLERAEQVAELSESLQELALDATGIPLLLSVDQEGGRVTRLPYGPRPPGAMAVGATGDPALARELSAAVAEQLQAVGITLDLAPVLDTNTNPDNPVIGTRSFGSDPGRVAAFGTAAVDGLQSRGVAACAKHFPGHGDTATDSHHDLPVVDGDRDRLDEVELVPFRRAVDEGVDAVMSAHVTVPAVEPDEDVPATLSRRVLTGLLREDLGHGGVVVTDCMEMDAVADGVGTVEGAVRAVEAGADAVLVSHTPELQRAAIDAVVDAVREGRIPESRIDDAARRVLALKERRVAGGGRGQSRLPSRPAVEAATAAVEEASERVAREAVTVVRDREGLVPLDGGPVTLVSLSTGGASPVEEDGTDDRALVDRLDERGFEVSYAPLDRDDDVPRPAEDPVVTVTRNAVAEAWQAAAVETLLERDRAVVVLAVESPYDARAVPAGTVLTTYDDSPAMLAAAADVLAGRRAARGSLPVALE